MIRKRLSDLARVGLCLVVASMIAVPTPGTKANVNTAWADTAGNTLNLDLDSFELTAFAADTPVSSLQELQEALEAAQSLLAEVDELKKEAEADLRTATAEHKMAEAEHSSAQAQANVEKQNAEIAIENAKREAQKAYEKAKAALTEAQTALSLANVDLNGNGKDKKDPEYIAGAKADYAAAEKAYNEAYAEYSDYLLQHPSLSSLSAAENAYKAEKENYDKIYKQYEQAKRDYGIAEQKLKNEYEAASAEALRKKEAAEKDYRAKTTIVGQKEEAWEAAKAALAAAKATGGELDTSALQSAVSDAESALRTAKTNQASAKSALETAQADLVTAKEKLSAAQTAYENAGGPESSDEVQAAKQTMDEKKKTWDDLKIELATAEGELNALKASLNLSGLEADRDNAKTAYDNAVKAVEDAEQEVQNANNKLNSQSETFAVQSDDSIPDSTPTTNDEEPKGETYSNPDIISPQAVGDYDELINSVNQQAQRLSNAINADPYDSDTVTAELATLNGLLDQLRPLVSNTDNGADSDGQITFDMKAAQTAYDTAEQTVDESTQAGAVTTKKSEVDSAKGLYNSAKEYFDGLVADLKTALDEASKTVNTLETVSIPDLQTKVDMYEAGGSSDIAVLEQNVEDAKGALADASKLEETLQANIDSAKDEYDTAVRLQGLAETAAADATTAHTAAVAAEVEQRGIANGYDATARSLENQLPSLSAALENASDNLELVKGQTAGDPAIEEANRLREVVYGKTKEDGEILEHGLDAALADAEADLLYVESNYKIAVEEEKAAKTAFDEAEDIRDYINTLNFDGLKTTPISDYKYENYFTLNTAVQAHTDKENELGVASLLTAMNNAVAKKNTAQTKVNNLNDQFIAASDAVDAAQHAYNVAAGIEQPSNPTNPGNSGNNNPGNNGNQGNTNQGNSGNTGNQGGNTGNTGNSGNSGNTGTTTKPNTSGTTNTNKSTSSASKTTTRTIVKKASNNNATSGAKDNEAQDQAEEAVTPAPTKVVSQTVARKATTNKGFDPVLIAVIAGAVVLAAAGITIGVRQSKKRKAAKAAEAVTEVTTEE